ncbi:hypothetical protein CALVIDRAFT_538895 [Calocera viscosa TUFC12733]|uniref:Uncharacterized protein n=1 Tax=Calocera viscosa (strain TUFC12733) TaxID=1330018 RepID=A0A167KAP8_CALVF|nr:hypothetical protein CALVIDRAFT_538895 [Calocera viscosa TUFC12733]
MRISIGYASGCSYSLAFFVGDCISTSCALDVRGLLALLALRTASASLSGSRRRPLGVPNRRMLYAHQPIVITTESKKRDPKTTPTTIAPDALITRHLCKR